MIRTRQKARQLAALFAALFAVCFLLTLSGCQNPVQSPRGGGELSETGTLSLSIEMFGRARTILPGSWDDFAAFTIEFVHYENSSMNFKYDEWHGSGEIQVPTGTWDLTLTAFALDEAGVSIPVATGVYNELMMTAGESVPVSILLVPLPGTGNGRFEWDIAVHESVISAKLEIFLYDDPLPAEPTHARSFDDVAGAIEGGHSLPAGRYLVILTLHNDDNEEIEMIEILHIYRNMISVFDPDFSSLHFPSSLAGVLAEAWNGASFGDLPISHLHFAILDIEGIYADNFASIIGKFAYHYPAAIADQFPDTAAGLKVLVDAALVGMARYSLSIGGHEYPQDILEDIAELIRNGSEIASHEFGADYATITVLIGGYSVVLFIDGVPGDTLAEQLLWLRLHGQEGGSYIIRISGDATITATNADNPANAAVIAANQMLPVGRNLVITFRGIGDAPSRISLLANGNIFRIQSGVTLILENVALVGRMVGGNGNANNNNQLVRINNGGTLILNDGSAVTGNRIGGMVSGEALGGGVRVNNGGTLILNGGEISGNSVAVTISANLLGAGVRVEAGGRFYMLAGNISGNSTNPVAANLAAGNGGGVWVAGGANPGIFRISGGTVHGRDAEEALRNTADNDGASLFIVAGGIAEHGEFAGAFDGSTVGSVGGFARSGDLRTDNVTVNVAGGERLVQERTGGLALQLDWLRTFAQDNTAYNIDISEAQILVPTTTPAAGGLGRPLPVGRSGVTITIRGTEPETSIALPIETGAINQGTLFRVPSGVTLVLDNVTLIGRSHDTTVGLQNNMHLVQVDADGTLRMMAGSRIIGNHNNQVAIEGGGVRVNSGGTFDMLGGTISGNNAIAGGGVFIGAGGTFRISGGTIHGNDEADATLRNVSRSDIGASLGNHGVAMFGTFDDDDRFDDAGVLGTNNRTITVTNGIFVPPPEPPPTASLAERLDWLRAFGGGDADVVLEITASEGLTPADAALPAGRTVILVGVGGNHELYLTDNGVLFTVGPGTTLVLENLRLVGRSVGGNGNANNNNHLVRVNAGGTLRMNAGSRVTGNHNTSTMITDTGGGVRVNAGGAFVLDGGIISGNGATANNTAGGVHVAPGGIFDMIRGEISGNTATGPASGTVIVAGGVIVAGTVANPAVFNMHGGTISGNSATNNHTTVNIAGGVRVGAAAAGSTFNMRGGTIFGNEAISVVSTVGGGVNVGPGSFFRISGGAVYGIDEDVGYGNIADNGSVALFRATADTGALYGTFDNEDEFIPAASGGILPNMDFTVWVTGGALVVPSEPTATESLAKRLAWLRAFGQGDELVLEISGDESLIPGQSALPDGRTTVLRGIGGGGHGIYLAANGVLFTVSSSTTLVLEDVRLVGRSVDGNGNANNDNSLIRITAGGTLRMNAGSRITGNTGTGTAAGNIGGGVHVSGAAGNPGALILDGGIISGNTATGNSTAGGVHIAANGTVTMYRGAISDNIATGTSVGGGVFMGAPATFNMHGGAVFGNMATSVANVLNVGGVRVGGSNSVFNMRGGVFSGNRSLSTQVNSSGGVAVISGGFLRISDGIIHGIDAGADANESAVGRAALSRVGATGAQRGTFDDAGVFQPMSDPLDNSNNTIEVENGVLLSP